jgi:CRISPR-associated exonuclease Cas4
MLIVPIGVGGCFVRLSLSCHQYTIDGTTLHERVHTLGENDRGEVWQVRAIYLKSEKYNLIGKSDLVEVESGEVYPIEYKRGKKGEWDNDELQVCAQALCLEEMMGQKVTTGYVYYAQSHQRQLVEINDDLRREAIATIDLVANLLQTGIAPVPVYSQRCRGCSLYSQCLPQANKKMKSYREVD